MVAFKPLSVSLLELCKDMDICTLVIELPVNEDETNQTFKQLFYNHAFLQFDYYFAIGWPCIVLILYVGITGLYYRFGHPKKLIINTADKEVSETKETNKSVKLVLNEQKNNAKNAKSQADAATIP